MTYSSTGLKFILIIAGVGIVCISALVISIISRKKTLTKTKNTFLLDRDPKFETIKTGFVNTEQINVFDDDILLYSLPTSSGFKGNIMKMSEDKINLIWKSQELVENKIQGPELSLPNQLVFFEESGQNKVKSSSIEMSGENTTACKNVTKIVASSEIENMPITNENSFQNPGANISISTISVSETVFGKETGGVSLLTGRNYGSNTDDNSAEIKLSTGDVLNTGKSGDIKIETGESNSTSGNVLISSGKKSFETGDVKITSRNSNLNIMVGSSEKRPGILTFGDINHPAKTSINSLRQRKNFQRIIQGSVIEEKPKIRGEPISIVEVSSQIVRLQLPRVGSKLDEVAVGTQIEVCNSGKPNSIFVDVARIISREEEPYEINANTFAIFIAVFESDNKTKTWLVSRGLPIS